MHFNSNHERKNESSIFITEGDSASGSITKSRDVNTQAVFSLRGKPLNSYGLTKEIVYKNEEFNLLQAALNVEDGMDGLRYNKIIIATDADVDGAHIRTLLLTFFYRYMQPLIKEGHVFIAQPPLYLVRKGQKHMYAYSDDELQKVLDEVGRDNNPYVQRYKGLGEMNPEQLWETTMNPEARTVLQVHLEDAAEADAIFSVLMGDKVEPRRQFIEQNAGKVRNLDL